MRLAVAEFQGGMKRAGAMNNARHHPSFWLAPGALATLGLGVGGAVGYGLGQRTATAAGACHRCTQYLHPHLPLCLRLQATLCRRPSELTQTVSRSRPICSVAMKRCRPICATPCCAPAQCRTTPRRTWWCRWHWLTTRSRCGVHAIVMCQFWLQDRVYLR